MGNPAGNQVADAWLEFMVNPVILDQAKALDDEKNVVAFVCVVHHAFILREADNVGAEILALKQRRAGSVAIAHFVLPYAGGYADKSVGVGIGPCGDLQLIDTQGGTRAR